MNIKNQLVNWSQHLWHTGSLQQISNQLNQTAADIPQFWDRFNLNNYSWNIAKLHQIQNLLQVCAKHNKHIATQLKKLSAETSDQLVSVFKNKTFLKQLTKKMQLAPQTINRIETLLDKFMNNNGKISPAKLLIIVLFIALGAQLPLIFKDTFDFKGIILAVSTILDYVTIALQLAQHFQKNNSKK